MNPKLLSDIKEIFENEASGHDFFHLQRVVKMSKHIAQKENCTEEQINDIELIAWLHDIEDYKLNIATNIPTLLQPYFEKDVINTLHSKIQQIGFSNSFEKDKTTKHKTVKIVEDADQLDALGAIGIGRTFAYGGKKGNIMFDPSLAPKIFKSQKEYKTAKSTTINHFYEKLLLLKDKLHTPTAQEIARGRHEFMLNFLKQFEQEWQMTDF